MFVDTYAENLQGKLIYRGTLTTNCGRIIINIFITELEKYSYGTCSRIRADLGHMYIHQWWLDVSYMLGRSTRLDSSQWLFHLDFQCLTVTCKKTILHSGWRTVCVCDVCSVSVNFFLTRRKNGLSCRENPRLNNCYIQSGS